MNELKKLNGLLNKIINEYTVYGRIRLSNEDYILLEKLIN